MISLPENMVKIGTVVDIVPSCPHLDGTWRDDKPVKETHHDKKVRLKEFGGNSRIICGLQNLTAGVTDPEVLKVLRPMSLKELYRVGK